MRPGGKGEVWGERTNDEVCGCGRKVKLKERKHRDKEERRWEKGGTWGYLKDISQNVGEEKAEGRWQRRRISVNYKNKTR